MQITPIQNESREFRTLVEMLQVRADAAKDQKDFTFLVDGDEEEECLSLRDIEIKAKTIAVALLQTQQPGCRALLLYPPGLEYVAGYFGCLYGGIVAVPAYPPDPARLSRTLPRLEAVVADAQITVILTTSIIASMAELIFAQAPALKNLQWIATDSLDLNSASHWQDPKINSQDVAFLQYTSGSTGSPKGVILSHSNLLHNSELIYKSFRHSSQSRGVIWLPPYHDMGLIGGIIQPIYGGFPVVLISPISFLQKPMRWLKAISKYKATTSGGPNFAYDLCARKATEEECEHLDLSTWNVAFNGAEPIRNHTLDRFTEKFEVCGFSKKAFFPCYGLAESTLIVTGGRDGVPPQVRGFQGPALLRNLVAPPRSLVEIPVLLKGTFPTQQCITKDVSASGAFISTNTPLPLGMVVDLEIQSTKLGKSICVRGEVARAVSPPSSEAGIGVRFLVNNPETQSQLEKDVDQITKDMPSSGSRGAQVLVGCGVPLSNVEVVIVHPDTMSRCWVNQVGEIWVRSPSVALGYWNRPDESAGTFEARLLDTGEGPFLRTGDLGFIREQELFVAGRLKDLIIIRGANHFPQDIERTVERAHAEALRPGCGAAFSIEVDGEEHLVVAQEIDRRYQGERRQNSLQLKQEQSSSVAGNRNIENRRMDDPTVQAFSPPIAADVPPDMQEVISSIRHAISREHGLQVQSVILLKAGSIPKTSSGKIQRFACRNGFLSKTLDVVVEWQAQKNSDLKETAEFSSFKKKEEKFQSGNIPTSLAIQDWLVALLSARLSVAQDLFDRKQPLSRYGLDSLAAVEIKNDIESNLGVILPMASILGDASVEDIVKQYVVSQQQVSREQESFQRVTDVTLNAPLSPGQMGLWLTQQLDPTSCAYHVVSAVKIVSEFNLSAFLRAMKTVLQRHASLRTVFTLQNGTPIQNIQDGCAEYIFSEDAQNWNQADLSQTIERVIQQPFDLEHGPLLRVYIYKCAPKEHILVWIAHHTIIDFWSMAVIVKELGILYVGECQNIASRLVRPALDYTDFSRWKNEWLQSSEAKASLAYWASKLGHELLPLNYPTDNARSLVQTFEGNTVQRFLDPSLREGLREFGRQHGATLYVVLLATFKILLSRWCRQTDITVGSVSSGRTSAKLSGLVGYLVNTLALRTHLDGDPSIANSIAAVRKTVLEALSHEEIPFVSVVEHIHPDRQISRTPIFQVMFLLQKAPYLHTQNLTAFSLGIPGAQMQLGDLCLESMEIPKKAAQYDITFSLGETSQGLVSSIEYNSNLFDQSTIVRLTNQYETLLHFMLAHPEAHLNQIGFHTEYEKSQILLEWNDTKTENDSLDLIENIRIVSETHADHIALVFDDQHISYKKVFELIQSCATSLQNYGVGPDVLVALCMERSSEMVIACAAILAAGGAYIPLDPIYPKERLHGMLEDADVSILLMSEATKELLKFEGKQINFHQLCSIKQNKNIYQLSNANNLAYTIFTSGSTGKPKGVEISRQSLNNFLSSAFKTPGLRVQDKFLGVTTVSFDIAGLEMFLPLCSGASLVVASAEEIGDGPRLVELISKHQITVMQATPVTWKMLLVSGLTRKGSLTTALCGGEALSFDLANSLTERNLDLWNMYGPTETTIWSSLEKISPNHKTVGIGRAFDNTDFFISDNSNMNTLSGSSGEMYIGGKGLARGYLNREYLTSDRFVCDNYSKRYFVGDLGRFERDGRIECLGRVDFQVKIRGFRIELEEITASIIQQPNIKDVVVHAHQQSSSLAILVAYIIFENKNLFDAIKLKNNLSSFLPEYMIPSFFIPMESFPQTPNGKVDRKKLPLPDIEALRLTEFVAPRNNTEKFLAEIWKDLLKIEKISIHDDFFALGGHSLLATQAVSRLRQQFNFDVPLRKLFEKSTIAVMAEYLDSIVLAKQQTLEQISGELLEEGKV